MASRSLAKEATVISPADLADFVGREALHQHFGGNRVEKSSRQPGPHYVGALANTRREQICVGADTGVVDATGNTGSACPIAKML